MKMVNGLINCFAVFCTLCFVPFSPTYQRSYLAEEDYNKNKNKYKDSGLKSKKWLAWLERSRLKEVAEEISPLLTAIFQKSLDSGTVPDDWRSANVSAIFKKGDRFKASNYRPVSLTSLCCKIQEHIITSNILRHLEEHSILTDCQHGFRARRSCETQLVTLVHELAEAIDRGRQTDMIILDFSKAFDRVPHLRLLAKIHHYGIRGSTYN